MFVLGALGVLALADTVLIGLVAGPASSQRHWPGALDLLRTHVWPTIAILTVAGGVIVVWTIRVSRDTPAPIELRSMADQLATAVSSNWWFETERWHVLDPYPLPVRWIPADPGFLASWSAITQLANSWPTTSASALDAWAAGPTELSGHDNELAETVGRIPTGRLVLLGAPGAGKTILLIRLVLQLLARRRDGEPVPVLLPMASWNPSDDDFPTWMAEWMATLWAPLAQPVQAGSHKSVARALLDAGLIVPVLDGLDEIAQESRNSAIICLNDATGSIRGLILSCRSDAYATAVHPAPGLDVPLTGAAGVELCPLETKEVGVYLQISAGGPVGAARWTPVIEAMGADPPPPVAHVLTTPLMASLARAIYNPRTREDVTPGQPIPIELLDQHLFSTRESVERHLYDRFIPVSYLPHPNPEHASRRFRWTADQAERWLAFLARYLEDPEHRTTDLMWWRLDKALPEHRVMVTLCVLVGLVGAIGYPFPGFGIGIIAGLLTGLLARRFFMGGKDGLARGLMGGLLGGELAALFAAPFVGLGPHDELIPWFVASGIGIALAVAAVARLVPGAISGFIGTVVVIWYEHAPAFQSLRIAVGPGLHVFNGLGCALVVYVVARLLPRETPARGLRWSWLWFACGVTCGLALGFIVGFQHGLEAGMAAGTALAIAGGLTGLVGEPIVTNLSRTPGPTTVLRRDRSSFLASWLGVGSALGIGTGLQQALGTTTAGQPNGLESAVSIGIANLLGPAIVFATIQAAWGKYTTARVILALSGKLPWRLTAFLEDAAVNRGVLRQFGAVYQFRHVELQRRLAQRSRAATKELIAQSNP
jgi:hypothetical protein